MPRFRISLSLRLLAPIALIAIALPGIAGDWPQFRGPNRDGVSTESGLAWQWADRGPRIVWRIPLGGGFSAISVAHGRLFTMFSSKGDEVLGAFDAESGSEIWRRRVDSAYRNSFGGGPRSTPTVDGSVVYAMGAQGVLLAVDASTGQRVWNRDLKVDFSAQVPEWGVASSPVVDGDLLLIDVGGRDGYSVVALNKHDGDLVWHSQSDLPGYSSPIVVSVAGHRQAVFLTGTRAVGLDVANGSLLWSLAWKTRYDVNAATPILVGPDQILLSSGYGVGAALIQLRPAGETVSLQEIWRSRRMKNQFSSSVVVGDTLYGFDNTILKSIRLADGEENWLARGFGHGSLFSVDRRLVVLGEQGRLAVVKASPDEFEELASTQLFSGKAWTVPTVSNGRLYARDENELLAISLTDEPLNR